MKWPRFVGSVFPSVLVVHICSALRVVMFDAQQHACGRASLSDEFSIVASHLACILNKAQGPVLISGSGLVPPLHVVLLFSGIFCIVACAPANGCRAVSWLKVEPVPRAQSGAVRRLCALRHDVANHRRGGFAGG